MFFLGVFFAATAAVAYGVSTVLRALGARRAAVAARSESGDKRNPMGGPTVGSTVSTLTDPAFLAGTITVMIGFLGGAFAARYLPLFLSQTIVSGNLVVTALLGTRILGIRLHTRDWLAISVVIISLCMLGLSSSHHPGGGENNLFHWGLLFATIAISAAALACVFLLGRSGAIAGGASAGLLYGIVAIAARVMRGIDPFDPVALLTDPAVWSLAIAGAVAFWVQTIALQLGAVNGVTAVLVVGEVAGPGIVGVVFLSDSARPGYEWLAIVGFIGAVIGAMLVAWYGSHEADHFGEKPQPDGGWRRGARNSPANQQFDADAHTHESSGSQPASEHER